MRILPEQRAGNRGIRLLFLVLALFAPGPLAAAGISPLQTANQSPLVQIFGLPAPASAIVLPAGSAEGMLAVDAASNFAHDSTGRERIMLDGESYRITLALRYGLARGAEGGIEIPCVGQGGGFFDSFIEGWHDFFGLPQGGRSQSPRNRLLYLYEKDGQSRLKIDDSSFAIGDLRLTGGVQLFNDGLENPRALALRASLKLPTGDAGRLHGSGSTDFALWLAGSDDYRLPALGHITLFGAAGGMALSDGRVLAGQQRNLAGFATLGFGWGPAEWIDLKSQVSGHTPFFRNSDLRELNKGALQLVMGGSLNFTPRTSLDIGVSEDLAVNTSPDVALHLAMRHRF